VKCWFCEEEKERRSCETTALSPRGLHHPRNSTKCHEKEKKRRPKNGTKESSVAVLTTISGLKIPPVGEKNKLLKAELAFLSITAVARDAYTTKALI